MEVTKRDGRTERRVLAAMILNRSVVAAIASKWDKDGLFTSRWANLIGKWAVKHYQKYEDPAGEAIQTYFESWAAKTKEKETVESVERFLTYLSQESQTEKKNSQYLLDLASEHFNSVRYKKLAEDIQAGLTLNQISNVDEVIAKFHRVELGVGSGVDVLEDPTIFEQAFEQQAEDILTLPGALGEFVKGQLTRDAFISFWAPEKRGKSWWLQEMVWQGVRQRLKVAYFQTGDQSQSQVIRRLTKRILRRSFKPLQVQYPKDVKVVNGEATVSTYPKQLRGITSWKEAWKEVQEYKQKRLRTSDSLLKLSCHPAGTLSLNLLNSILQTWEQQSEWTPDLVVIDYADIMALSNPDRREGTNDLWQGLRALSQRQHCLVITASQTDASSYNAKVLTRSHFTEDKRKLAHVTGALGINQTPQEKESGLYRLNWIALREGEYNEFRCCHVAGCLSIGCPCIVSAL